MGVQETRGPGSKELFCEQSPDRGKLHKTKQYILFHQVCSSSHRYLPKDTAQFILHHLSSEGLTGTRLHAGLPGQVQTLALPFISSLSQAHCLNLSNPAFPHL